MRNSHYGPVFSVLHIKHDQHQVRPRPAQIRRCHGEKPRLPPQVRVGTGPERDELYAEGRRNFSKVSVNSILKSKMLLYLNYWNF